MPAPEAFYLVCKGLALLGAVRIGHELVVVLAVLIWQLIRELDELGNGEE